ncbi:hypothetical protein E5F05_13755 [Deinococcus metallilatus]|uniref:DUF4402 domain-containing protein n=1 Tax=Deinococcus metallilatus TaxID=1211322 RepID=A0AAJ5F4W8_9DEIO|nr:hypothetical protein [Deinococcus metallilatus]MBB5294132.1 hypothetical protein [Deinococcus metallilatus]QBY08915.1 hypothetical protein E5F05_13755 [Deinococcus metallilatus]RXJ10059.1 hypothetical protein ERJ73_12585 [Deinococcus metallilatus]TLK28004.1 hypothetical protein FCS05_08795 [Deinococcus metallilatus]GMA16532.1 hypothetical protein GCM10025871_28630 [Deinococcus metallilatus]
MRRTVCLLLALAGQAGAQFAAPGITLTPSSTQAAPLEVARHVLVQPERLETRLQTGYTTGNLNFTLFSEVNTEVVLKTSDPRLVLLGSENGVVRLNAYSLQSVSGVALGAHNGTLTVSNRAGQVLVTVPYIVAPAKALNQSVSFYYTPGSNQGSLSYAVSGNPQSPLDPRWSMSVGVNVNPREGRVGGSVGLNVSW